MPRLSGRLLHSECDGDLALELAVAEVAGEYHGVDALVEVVDADGNVMLSYEGQ